MTKTCGRCKKDFTTEPDNHGQATCQACRAKLNDWFNRNKKRIYLRDKDRYATDGYPYQRKYNQQLRETAIAKYGGKCACCGITHLEVLCIDHKHGGGAQHHAQLKKTGVNIYLHLKRNNYPPNYQILCWNCNQSLALYGFSPLNPSFQHNSPSSQKRRKRRRIQDLIQQCDNHVDKTKNTTYGENKTTSTN